jgi:hypothetical protein
MIAPARETRGGGVLAAMANFDLTLRGDQIGRFDTLAAAGNGTAMTVTLGGVRALGPAAAIYTVRMEQVTVGETQIQNGQFMTIFDATGAVVMPKTTVQPDRYQGRGRDRAGRSQTRGRARSGVRPRRPASGSGPAARLS